MTESENPRITTEQQITALLKSNNTSAVTKQRDDRGGYEQGENMIRGRTDMLVVTICTASC